MATTPVQPRSFARLSSPATLRVPPVMRRIPCDRGNWLPGDSPMSNCVTSMCPPCMFTLAVFVRPSRVITVTFVVSGNSRTTIAPLLSVMLPAQTLKSMNRPVTTNDELFSSRAPPPARVNRLLAKASGLFSPSSAKRRVLVAPGGAARVKAWIRRFRAGVDASIVTVLESALVTYVEPKSRLGGCSPDQLVASRQSPLLVGLQMAAPRTSPHGQDSKSPRTNRWQGVHS